MRYSKCDEIAIEKLRLENIRLAYDDRTIIDGISFGINTGELVGIVGPNGCGKSTLIKGITRVLPLKTGHIYVDDQDVLTIPQNALARLIAVVPQSTALPEAFSSFEMVLMGRNPHMGFLRYEGQKDIDIAVKAMQTTDTWHLAERQVGELSGGERQRLTIARALTQETPIILLDEPTSHLDINYQIETMELMSSLCRKNGLAVLTTLHDLNLAAQYCDRIIMLLEGKIYAEGSASEIITPASVKAAYGANVSVSAHPVNRLPAVLITAGWNRVHDRESEP
jgi:iron complex transport system ATP-binding protein